MKNSKEQTAVEDEKRMNGLPYYKAYPRDLIEWQSARIRELEART